MSSTELPSFLTSHFLILLPLPSLFFPSNLSVHVAVAGDVVMSLYAILIDFWSGRKERSNLGFIFEISRSARHISFGVFYACTTYICIGRRSAYYTHCHSGDAFGKLLSGSCTFYRVRHFFFRTLFFLIVFFVLNDWLAGKCEMCEKGEDVCMCVCVCVVLQLLPCSSLLTAAR